MRTQSFIFCESDAKEETLTFLQTADQMFHIPLSRRTSLSTLAEKISIYGHCILAKYSVNGHCCAGICWYDNDVEQGQAFITALAVMPEFRGLGLAKALLNHVFSKLPNHIVSLRLHTDNIIALNLYQSVGFTFETGDSTPADFQEKGCFLTKTIRRA